MENWNENQQQFIDKLDKAGRVFNDILEKDRNYMVINFDERGELDKLRARNSNVLNKLRTKEFTVAVVGLEKAGKSTLGNALLKLMVLPEYTERCTYTTTEIRSGNEDEGEIVFYSVEEFNADFRKMLDQVKYPSGINFSNIDLNSFNRHWENMEQKDYAMFNLYNGTTVEDIRAIIEGRSILNSMLGKSPRKFVGDSELKGDEFQRYITGIDDIINGSVIRSPHPYAVKKVNIKSRNLGDMKNIVLFDVPGFDSPTDLHKKQTKQMLQEADAIILVTNVTEPSLKGTQLDMLRTVQDEDGVRLSEKAFVFGNKLDMAANKQIAIDDKRTLQNEAVNKHRIATINHVFAGSAKAYLEGLNLRSKDEERRGAINVASTLEEWGMENGIESLVKGLTDYYNNDRFEVLKKRAEKTLSDAEEFLNDILEKNSSENGFVVDAGGEHYISAVVMLDTFKRRAWDISDSYQKMVYDDKPFSKIIIDNIEEIYPHETLESELIRDVEHENHTDTDRIYIVSHVEPKVRHNLQSKFTKAIVERTDKATTDMEAEVYQKLIETFLEVQGAHKDSHFYSELVESVRQIFDEILSKKGKSCQFNTLVERFTTSLIEAVIEDPFASKDRLDKLKAKSSFPEFISLAAYYGSDENSEPKFTNDRDTIKILSMILCHDGVASSDMVENEYEENQNALREFFEKNRKQLSYGADLAIELLPLGKWAKILGKAGINFINADKRMKKRIEDVLWGNDWDRYSPDVKIALIDKAVDKECSNSGVKQNDSAEGKSLYNVLQEMHEQALSIKNQREQQIDKEFDDNQQEQRNIAKKQFMIDTLNVDIDILRELTVKSVVKAINLERAFCSVITNNINYIREQANSPIVQKWIKNNVSKIKEEEFIKINSDRVDAETKRSIVEAIKNVLPELRI